MKIVDGDSHLIEPLDLFLRYIEPAYRERAMCVVNDSITGKQRMVVDGKPIHLGNDTEEMLSVIVGHGQKEEGHALNEFDRSLIAAEYGQASAIFRYGRNRLPNSLSHAWAVMGRRGARPTARRSALSGVQYLGV